VQYNIDKTGGGQLAAMELATPEGTARAAMTASDGLAPARGGGLLASLSNTAPSGAGSWPGTHGGGDNAEICCCRRGSARQG